MRVARPPAMSAPVQSGTMGPAMPVNVTEASRGGALGWHAWCVSGRT
jgi:hypothetical protein